MIKGPSATKRKHKTQAANATTKRKHQTQALMGDASRVGFFSSLIPRENAMLIY